MIHSQTHLMSVHHLILFKNQQNISVARKRKDVHMQTKNEEKVKTMFVPKEHMYETKLN